MSLPRFLRGFPRAASGAQACLGRKLSVQFEAKITGKVVTKEAHIPVQKVKLVLVVKETGWTRTAWSDADGHFEFHVLDPKAVLGAKSQTVTISFEKTTGVQAHQQLRHLFMCGDDVCGPGKGDGGAAYPPGPSIPSRPPPARHLPGMCSALVASRLPRGLRTVLASLRPVIVQQAAPVATACIRTTRTGYPKF